MMSREGDARVASQARSAVVAVLARAQAMTMPRRFRVRTVSAQEPVGLRVFIDAGESARHDTPTIGTRRADAIAFAVATPTRRPVNRPGPRSTAMAPISDSSIRAFAHRNSIAK